MRSVLATLLAIPVFAFSVNLKAEESCADRKMDCMLSAYTACQGMGDMTEECHERTLATCDRICGGRAPVRRAISPGYTIRPQFTFSESCGSYQRLLNRKIRSAVNRLKDCLNYAFVKEDIAQRMIRVLEMSPPIHVRCDQPPNRSWCGAAGLGEVWLAPRCLLRPGGLHYEDFEAFFIHEVVHIARLEMGPGHNETGEGRGTDPDEVYSLMNYCMRPARMWISRARRTRDVVQPAKLSCMRAYQEMTPSTLLDPFWGEFKARVDRNQNPCPARRAPRRRR